MKKCCTVQCKAGGGQMMAKVASSWRRHAGMLPTGCWCSGVIQGSQAGPLADRWGQCKRTSGISARCKGGTDMRVVNNITTAHAL